MRTLTSSDIAEMPIQERIQLVEDIWNSIIETSEAVEIPEWHKKELDNRIEGYNRNPDEGSSWKDVKKRVTCNNRCSSSASKSQSLA